MRPWSAAALAGAVLWILACAYEVFVREKSSFSAGPGTFMQLEAVVQLSSLGVLGLTALAWLIEHVWPPSHS